MRRRILLAAAVRASLSMIAVAEEPAAQKVEFFEKHVRPIFVGHCYGCHSADTKPAGGLRLDDRNGLMSGGDSGPAVVAGAPEKSLLLKRVTQQGNKRMPLEGEHLSDEQVATLTRWITDGAAWPATVVPASLGLPPPRYEQLQREHWAWQPLTSPAVPQVKDNAWPRADVDRFILAKLEAQGLSPVGDADRRALLRRVTFDLTGLPPTPDAIDSFLQDDSSTALEKIVDQLLASPAFGERFGRHWLDVARYGESTGPSRNIPYPHAWRYRDYVIDAVNADLPFNRFVEQQIAGDLLPTADDAQRDRLTTATGFLALGVKDVNQRFKTRFEMDNVDEQIDAITRSVLGLTVSCARCHDHKFDPVPTTDYYALAGIFTSTENAAGVRNKMGGGGLDYYNAAALLRLGAAATLPVDAQQVAQLEAQIAAAKKEWDEIRGTPKGLEKGPNGQPFQRQFRVKYENLQAKLAALTDPAQRAALVHGVREARSISDTEVRIRGEAEKLGPRVPRGFLTAIGVPDAAPVSSHQSGRLELAQWLTSNENALAQRVIVNRVWQHLFGRGIVSTVDNFGVMGDAPSHPELLDHLAGGFVANDWSVKQLVRRLVLTRTYQLSADATSEHLAVDPGNTLLWRHAPRRLSAEEMRDAILASAGTLDLQRPSGSPVQKLRMVEMNDNGAEAKAIHEAANAATYRSVYLPQLRGLVPSSLAAFDPVDTTLVSGTRDTTTVAGQALFLLNSPLVRQQSLALAEKLLREQEASDAERIQIAYRRTLAREATQMETERATIFLSEFAAAFGPQPPAIAEAVPSGETVASTGDARPVDNPDAVDQTGVAVTESPARPSDARTAAWLALVQALYASAEFRYVR